MIDGPATIEFESLRPYLLALSYRMLGAVADAEDTVQEAYLRWHRADHPIIKEPRAWFTRVCTRLCLDRIKAGRARREQYPGQWLPEPFVEDRRTMEIDETISMALVHTLQRLSVRERAVFILHDIFDYKFREISAILEVTPATCRQIASRARARIQGDRPRFEIDSARAREMTDAFLRAIDHGDHGQLQAMLMDEVMLTSDGGGQVQAVPKPIEGQLKVARFLLAVLSRGKPSQPVSRRDIHFNGAPGVLLFHADGTTSALQLTVSTDGVRAIYIQRNPKKLKRLLMVETGGGWHACPARQACDACGDVESLRDP